jgi:hypothetical protein
MQKIMDPKSTNKQPQEKKFDSEVVRQYIVDKHKRDPNAKHIEKAASQIQSKINNFNGPMNGRSAKVMPKSKVSESAKELQMDKVDEAILGGSASQRAAAKFSQNSAGRIAAMVRKEKARKAAQDDAHFEKQSKKMQDAINLHLRKGKTYSDAVKAAKVHVKEEVELDEAFKLKTKVRIHAPGKSYHNTEGTIGEVRPGLYKGAPKMFTVYHGERGAIQLPKENLRIVKEEIEQVDEKMNDLQKKAVKSALDYRSKIGMKSSTSDAKKIIKFVKNEEVEQIDEGRGRPPKVGSKAWHAAKAKAQSGESSDQEADKNIVNQMRKKPVGDTHHLVFGNGEKKEVHVKHVNKALSMLANTPKPADREKLQASLGHSHKRFMDTVTSGKPVEDAPRPKVTLAKSAVREAVDPSTTPAGTGHIIIQKRRMADGSYRIVKAGKSHSHKDLVDAQEAVTMYDPAKSEEAEEKREGQGAPKGASVDMTKDSCDKMQALSPQAFKQKFKLPPTLGNIAAGGEDTVYGKGKYSVAEEKTLNNLYVNLSEENKEIFDLMLQSEEGIESLLSFASKQGY